MTVYFMGTEAEDFPNRGGTVAQGGSGVLRRSANTRLAVILAGAAEDTNYIETDAISVTDFWTHAVLGIGGGAGTIGNTIKWYAGGTQKLAFRWTTTSGTTLEVRKWNGSSWDSLATGTDALYVPPLTAVPLTFYIKLGNPGEFRVWYNALPVISRNDLDLSGIGAIDKVRFQSFSTAITANYSEVIVANFNLLGAKIVSRPPTGNGSYQEWTNGAFGIVDDTDATGADVALSGTVGQRTTYTHAAFTALAGSEALAAVKVSAAAVREAAGPQNLNFMTRIGSTDYNGTDKALNTTLTRIGYMWETSPATAVAWTVAELNAAHMGVRSRT
jgi:hypothetical protein